MENIKRAMRMEGRGDNRSSCVRRPCAYVRKDTAENECELFYGVSKRQEYVTNIRTTCGNKV